MSARSEKGGGAFEGIKLLLCENPLPPIDEAIEAAREEVPRGSYDTQAFSAPLRRMLAGQNEVPERLVHINASSELTLRQLFQRLGACALVEPLGDSVPGDGYMRITTALPEDNRRFIPALVEVLGRGEDRTV